MTSSATGAGNKPLVGMGNPNLPPPMEEKACSAPWCGSFMGQTDYLGEGAHMTLLQIRKQEAERDIRKYFVVWLLPCFLLMVVAGLLGVRSQPPGAWFWWSLLATCIVAWLVALVRLIVTYYRLRKVVLFKMQSPMTPGYV